MQTNGKRSVIGIVLTDDKREIIAIKRRDIPIWVLPGGGVENGETPSEAIIREVHEETGLNIAIIRHIALYTPINRLAYPTYVFECRIVSGTLSTGEEAKEIGFFPMDHLPKPFFFLHREWIEDARKNITGLIQKPLTQITYWNLFKYFCCHPIQVVRLLLSRIGKPINNR